MRPYIWAWHDDLRVTGIYHKTAQITGGDGETPPSCMRCVRGAQMFLVRSIIAALPTTNWTPQKRLTNEQTRIYFEFERVGIKSGTQSEN